MKYYIEYIYPGIIVSETSHSEIPEGDFLHPEKVELEDAFGFRFVKREEIEHNGETLVGKYQVVSGWYFEGEKLSKGAIKEVKGENSTVYKNMEYNHHDYVVRTKYGQYIPLEKEDTVIKYEPGLFETL